jgi:hypothetical protein
LKCVLFVPIFLPFLFNIYKIIIHLKTFTQDKITNIVNWFGMYSNCVRFSTKTEKRWDHKLKLDMPFYLIQRIFPIFTVYVLTGRIKMLIIRQAHCKYRCNIFGGVCVSVLVSCVVDILIP